MKTEKLVKGLFPKDGSVFWENIAYLEEQAEKGLLLHSQDGMHLLFQKGEPQKMRYHIEYGKDLLTEEEKEVYAEAGWDYVFWYDNFHIFSAPRERQVREIHTDPMEQGEVLDGYMKKQIRKKIWDGALRLFPVTLLAFLSFHPYVPVKSFFTELAGIWILILPLYIRFFIDSWKEIKNYKAIREDLRMGIPLPMGEEKAPRTLWNRFWLIYAVILFIFVCAYFFGSCQPRSYEVSPNHTVTTFGQKDIAEAKFPLVLAEDILDTTGFTRLPESSVEGCAGLLFRRSQITFEYLEAGDLELRVYNEYYNMPAPWLAVPMAKEIRWYHLGFYQKEDMEETLREVEDSRFDVVYVTKGWMDEENWTVAKGQEVLQVACNEAVEEEIILDAMAKALEAE